MQRTQPKIYATGFFPAPGDKGKPITVTGTNSIRGGFDAMRLPRSRSMLAVREVPVTALIRNAFGVRDWEPFIRSGHSEDK